MHSKSKPVASSCILLMDRALDLDLKTWTHGVSICIGSSPSAIFLGQNPFGLQYRNLSILSTFTVDDFFFHFMR